jgi:serine/threonine protein phosphatase PrpC
VRAASITGVRHRLAGQPNEDYFAWSQSDNLLVLAVADGLGSIVGSGQAALRACRAAVSAALCGEVSALSALARAALHAANAAALGGGATTLVIAIVSRDGHLEVCRVGDSTAFVVQGGDACELFAPRDVDSVGSATAALPVTCDDSSEDDKAEFWERAASELREGQVLVVATDGLADPWRDGPQTVGPALVEVVTSSPSPLELATAVDFSRQGCHDDRTVLCAWLRPG